MQLPEKDRDATERRLAAKSQGTAGEPPAWVAALIEDIRKYCAGEKIDFSAIAVDLGGIDDFRQKLYAALRGIGFGRTVTYGDLAKQLGLPGWEGARDVGEAMGSNRDADRDPVPSRARRRQQAGRLLGLWRHHDQAEAAGAGGRRLDKPKKKPRQRTAAVAGTLVYFPIVSTIRPRTLRSLMSRNASANCSSGYALVGSGFSFPAACIA